MHCSQCGGNYHWSKFSPRKGGVNRKRSSACRACMALYQRGRRRANPEEARAWSRAQRIRHPVRTMLRSARARAAKRGVPFAFSDQDRERLEHRLRRGVCELTGIPLKIGGGLSWQSPSLDRRDAARGYVYDNVRIVIFGLNAALGSWGPDVLLEMVRKYKMKRRRK